MRRFPMTSGPCAADTACACEPWGKTTGAGGSPVVRRDVPASGGTSLLLGCRPPRTWFLALTSWFLEPRAFSCLSSSSSFVDFLNSTPTCAPILALGVHGAQRFTAGALQSDSCPSNPALSRSLLVCKVHCLVVCEEMRSWGSLLSSLPGARCGPHHGAPTAAVPPGRLPSSVRAWMGAFQSAHKAQADGILRGRTFLGWSIADP